MSLGRRSRSAVHTYISTSAKQLRWTETDKFRSAVGPQFLAFYVSACVSKDMPLICPSVCGLTQETFYRSTYSVHIQFA